MSDEEDLDYVVTALNQCKEFVFVIKKTRPVVVLLGWAGCQDRYLAKYSAIYKEKSYITLRYTAPVEYLFWKRDKLPSIGKRLMQVIIDRCLDQNPIFFHVFSNGGAFLYQHVSLAMQQSNTPFNVKGVIFDSAPGERRLTTLFKAVSVIIGGHPLMNIPMSFFITIYLYVLWFFEVHAFGSSIQTNPITLAEEPYSWPQLFLYSDVDTLIPPSDVEKFARRRAERGVRVQLVLFTNSPHVKHYATYRDIYVSTICSFMHECLIPSNSISPESPQDCGEENSWEKYDSLPGLTKRVVLPHEASQQMK